MHTWTLPRQLTTLMSLGLCLLAIPRVHAETRTPAASDTAISDCRPSNAADVALPPAETGWRVLLDDSDGAIPIPQEGLVFFSAIYTVGANSGSAPRDLDGLITVTVQTSLKENVMGTFTYEEGESLALWRSAGPLDPGATYALELLLAHHDNTPAETLTFEMVAAQQPAGPPEPLAVPFFHQAEWICNVGPCCIPALSIQGPAAGLDRTVEIAFPTLDGTWNTSVVQSGTMSYSAFNEYEAITDGQLCYRATTLSKVSGLKTEVVRCVPNPPQDDLKAGAQICVYNPDTGRVEGEPATSTGAGGLDDAGCQGGAPPALPAVMLLLGSLWAIRRRTRYSFGVPTVR